MESTNRILAEALRVARLGFKVFPLVPGRKTPLVTHGLLEATEDEDQIEKWWGIHSRANLGMSTEGLLALDPDCANNPWLFDGSPEATARLESLQGVPTQRTPRGGFHFFFRQPAGRNWRNTFSALAYNVDTRASGGYVVLAPSVSYPTEKSKGGDYAWVPEHLLDVPPTALSEPPPWLIDALDSIAFGGSGKKKETVEAQDGNPIPEGRRNGALASIAGTLRQIGFSVREMVQALLEINRNRCVPPLPEEEVGKIAASIGRYEPDQIRTILAEGGVQWDQEGQADEAPHPGSFPPELLEVPGLLGEVIQFNLDTAIRPQPILALAGGISLLSTITGHKIQDDSRCQTNLYSVGLAPAGSGKEHARAVNKQIILFSGWKEKIGPESIGSSAGLISSVDAERVILFQLDELGRFLKTLRNPERSPHLYEVISVLLKLFSSSGSLYVGSAYADLKKVKSIQWPHAVLYGTGISESFFESLSTESLRDGFVARLLVFEVETPYPDRLNGTAKDVPAGIVEAVRAWKDFQPTGGNLNGVNPHPRILRTTDETVGIFQGFSELCSAERKLNRSGLGPLWLRAEEKAKKLAMIYAASAHGPQVSEIDGRASRWGVALSEHLTRHIIHRSAENVADSPFEADLKLILRLVAEGGEKGVTKSDLLRKVQRIRVSTMDELIARLLLTGSITQETNLTGKRGHPATIYRARRFK